MAGPGMVDWVKWPLAGSVVCVFGGGCGDVHGGPATAHDAVDQADERVDGRVEVCAVVPHRCKVTFEVASCGPRATVE